MHIIGQRFAKGDGVRREAGGACPIELQLFLELACGHALRGQFAKRIGPFAEGRG